MTKNVIKYAGVISLGCIALAGTLALSGCGESDSVTTKTVDYCTTANVEKMDFTYTDRDTSAKYSDNVVNVDLDGNISGDGVQKNGDNVEITKEATYVLKGSLSGQVVVNANDAKVQIVLDNADINAKNGSAIYVKDAKKAFITLADGSENNISDSTSYNGVDDGVDSAIYSKDDLTINGNGTLNVSGKYNHGIACKDDLLLCGGTINVSAERDGIRGKDCVKINGSTINCDVNDDAIVATDSNEDDKGYVSIDAGKITATCFGKGIVGQTYVRLQDGSADVTSTDDGIHCNVRVDVNGGS